MTTHPAPKTEIVEATRVTYQGDKPVGTASGLKDLLTTMKGSIAQALPKHVTPERLIKTLLVAANRNPDLLKCTQASILETINRAAELGLDLSGTLGEAYPVPFDNNVGTKERPVWVKQCSLMIGYRGMEKLAWQSGQVESIDAEMVYSNDKFLFKKGTEVVVEWCPALTGDRGVPIGAYACVAIKGGGRMARFLAMSDIQKIRNSSKSKDSPAWRNWPDEMGRKCALKRTLKGAPLSTEKYVRAMEHDDADVDLADVLEAETTGLRGLPSGRSSFTAQREVVDQGTGEVEGDGGTPVGETAKTVLKGSENPETPEQKDRREKMKEQAAKLKADEFRAKHGCRADQMGCAKEPEAYSAGPNGKPVCVNHAFREADEPSEGPVSEPEKPVRTSEEVRAEQKRLKLGCTVGALGCDSASIKVHKKGELPRCKNHPAPEAVE